MRAGKFLKGLSGFAREVSRQLLQRGDAISDEVLRLRVRRGLDLVERIFVQYRIDLGDLPPSQQRAYALLKQAAAPQACVPFLAPAPSPRTANRFHDLGALWHEVNTRYFDGRMQIDRLSWSQRASFQRLGFWDPEKNRIVISRSLDHPAVPPQVIQYILFHEGIHKQLGPDHREGARRFHTRTFHTLERTFPDWRKWEHFLRHDWPRLARG